MTVAELIEVLQKQDQKAEVAARDRDWDLSGDVRVTSDPDENIVIIGAK